MTQLTAAVLLVLAALASTSAQAQNTSLPPSVAAPSVVPNTANTQTEGVRKNIDQQKKKAGEKAQQPADKK